MPEDDKLLAFVRERADTLLKWDLLRFFHENNDTNDTSENIARYIGRDATETSAELDEMTMDGVLRVQQIAGIKVYSLNPDLSLLEEIELFMLGLEDSQLRARLTYEMIRASSRR